MIPYVKGKVALQAHVGIPEGLCEEEYGRSGFFGRYAHLYRTEAPVGWTRIEGPLRPEALDLTKTPAPRGDYLKDRRACFANQDVVLHFGRVSAPMDYWYRNADGDELLFVHEGAGRIETDFGPLAYEPGDYLLIPRGTVYRLLPTAATALLTVEGFSELNFPDKGMLGQHALFDPAVIRVPTPDETPPPAPRKGEEFELRIKRQDQLTSVWYPFRPINTVGWKGTLSVLQLNVRDIRPVTCERYHLPPSAHTTFVGKGFVVCTFLPRALETGDPAAMKVPFYHSNIDYDEILFYHAGEFFSRAGIKPGMLTFHPQGIHHGPQAQAAERAKDATHTNEIAVMLDTQRPLAMTPAARELEIPNYASSWRPKT